MLFFNRQSDGRRDRNLVFIDSVVIPCWAGCDEAAIRQHIEELAANGVPRPSAVPMDYRLSADLLTRDLIGRRPVERELSPGTLMFFGTLGTTGGIRPASSFEMQLADPVLGRRIQQPTMSNACRWLRDGTDARGSFLRWMSTSG